MVLGNRKFLFLIYGALIVLSCLGFEEKLYIPFYLAFAFLIGLLGYGSFTNESELNANEKGGDKRWMWLVVVALIIIFVSRIVPFLGFEAPLGYDTGIYKKSIENFARALPNLPAFSKGAWDLSQSWGLFLSTDLLSLIGLSSNQILYGYYILLNLLLGLSIYVVVKKFFNPVRNDVSNGAGQNAAILAIFIFALSLTQFQTYWMMYYKNIAGLFLMLIAFYLLAQKSWLVIPVAGFLGGLHQPTFLIFGLAMLINNESLSEFKRIINRLLITKRIDANKMRIIKLTNHMRISANNMRMKNYKSFADLSELCANNMRMKGLRIRGILASIREGFVEYYHLISGVGILAVAFSLYAHNPQAIFQFLSPNLEELVKTFGPGAGAGTFFDFNFYRQIITFYLPFALLGLIYLIQKRQFNYLFFYFVFNFAIVYFGFIFHNRFIIHLDIITIILAGVGGSYILVRLWPSLTGKVAITVLLIGAGYILTIVVLNKKPLISEEELAEIKSLAYIAKEDEYVMATDSYYSPWVYGYSERKTIAPGLFEHNKWNLAEWNAFWRSKDATLYYILLDKYPSPVYIFVGDKQVQLDFTGIAGFERISKRIWKYENK